MEDVARDRIAAAVNMLRPDWPVPSLRTLLGKPELANRPARDVAVALTWVACDPRTETPARVLLAGAWWRAANANGERTPSHLTMAQGCHCGRPLHEPDEDCPDPGRWRVHPTARRSGKTAAQEAARSAYQAARAQAQAAGEKTHDHRCSDACAGSPEHLAAMDADAWTQIHEAESS